MNTLGERDKLLNAAGEYALIASEALIQQFAHLSEEERELELDKSFEELQIHFLFPNLYDHERYLLLALKFANRGVALMVNTDQTTFDPDERRQHEFGTSQIEELFMDSKRQVIESGLPEKLSPVQREILEETFLSIHFCGVA